MDRLRVLFVSDMRGNDDEGMKKIARSLAAVLNKKNGLEAYTKSTRKALGDISSVDIMQYIGGPTYRSVLFAAWCKSKNKKLKTILTFVNPHLKFIGDTLMRNVPPDHIIVSSDYWVQWARRSGLSYSLLSVSGVDMDLFQPVLSERQKQLRKKLELPTDKIFVLHVGHLKDARNLKEFLKVQSDPDLQVIVVGSTTTKQSKQLVHCLSHAGCVVINSYQQRIEEIYQAVDCYVFPTIDHREAVQIPLSLLEAMATNLPVITTRFGGLPTYFPAASGLYYISSFDELPTIIKAAVTRQTRTRSLVGEFSWESIAERLYKLYLQILVN